MKLAWLVWYDEIEKERGEKPEFWTKEPEGWRCYVQIVYCEVTK